MSEHYLTHLQDHGRVVIPAAMRRALELQPGDAVVLRTEDRQIVISRLSDAIRQFQDVVTGAFPVGHSLSDELIAERRAEAARDV